MLLGAGVVVAVLVARLPLLQPGDPGRFTRPEGSARRRPVLPVAVGLVGGLLAVRASIEPVTEWDALIYHVSFARDWIASLPGSTRRRTVGGCGALVQLPGALPVDQRRVRGRAYRRRQLRRADHLTACGDHGPGCPSRRGAVRALSGLGGSMFLLGSTFFVAYGAWPTAYMLMTVLIVLAVARLVVERRLTLATALCIGLAAETGLIGIAFALVVLVAFFGVGLARRSTGRTDRQVPSASRAVGAVGVAVLLAAPLGVVVVGSLRRTGGVLFPWLTWPRAADLLPSLYWKATQHEILANSYGQFGAAVGSFGKALVGIAGSGLLAPGGIALQLLIVAACAVAYAQRRGALLAGVAVLAGAVVLFVALELVWLRYFVPMSVAAAAGLGAALGALRERRGGRVELIAYSAAVVAACLSVASGVAYALAGPNDRTYTAKIDYRTERYSAFEAAGPAANSRQRRLLVYGDDSRAWDDIDRLDAAGVGVGTFDIRNYYAPYVPRLQLDGLAGAAITGTTGAAVARQLKSRHIDAVFVPSWFWEPGAARHPLADRSPVASWVGVPALRAVRVYLPDPNVTYPSVLYIVGSTSSARRRVSSLLRSPTFSVAGALSTRRTIVRGGFAVSGPLGGPLHWRIAAPVTEIGGPSIRLTTEGPGRGFVGSPSTSRGYHPRQPGSVRRLCPRRSVGAGKHARRDLSRVAARLCPPRRRRRTGHQGGQGGRAGSSSLHPDPGPRLRRPDEQARRSLPRGQHGRAHRRGAPPAWPARARLRLPRCRPRGRLLQSLRRGPCALAVRRRRSRPLRQRPLAARAAVPARPAHGGGCDADRRARPFRERRGSHRPQSAAGRGKHAPGPAMLSDAASRRGPSQNGFAMIMVTA